jgi:hypothetical protein
MLPSQRAGIAPQAAKYDGVIVTNTSLTGHVNNNAYLCIPKSVFIEGCMKAVTPNVIWGHLIVCS